MSGVEVLGLLSAVITIIDVSAKLLTAIENTGNLPGTFKDAAQRLPLVEDTLMIFENRLSQVKLDETTCAAISTIVTSCKDKAEDIYAILKKVAAQPNATRLDKYHLAVRRLAKGGDLEMLMKGLLEDVHLLAANNAVRAFGDDRIGELMAAIEDLPKETHSMPNGPVLTYCGAGDMFNNTGTGTQNINKGTGSQYLAHTISFGHLP